MIRVGRLVGVEEISVIMRLWGLLEGIIRQVIFFFINVAIPRRPAELDFIGGLDEMLKSEKACFKSVRLQVSVSEGSNVSLFSVILVSCRSMMSAFSWLHCL